MMTIFFWVKWSKTGRDLSRSVEVCRDFLRFVEICEDLSGFVEIHRDLLKIVESRCAIMSFCKYY